MSKAGIARNDDNKQEGQNKGSCDGAQKGSGRRRADSGPETGKEGTRPRINQDIRNEYGGEYQWSSESSAFEGVPPSEKREHSGTRGCHRCGRSSHRAAQCYAATTVKGTNHPKAPWKVSAGVKRQREPEETDYPKQPPKVQKTAAVNVIKADLGPLWEREEEDFLGRPNQPQLKPLPIVCGNQRKRKSQDEGQRDHWAKCNGTPPPND